MKSVFAIVFLQTTSKNLEVKIKFLEFYSILIQK